MGQALKEESKNLSLDDALEVAYATHTSEEEEKKEEVPEKEVSVTDSTEEVKETEEEVIDDSQEVQKEGEKGKEVVPLEEPEVKVQAPQHWNKDELALWNKLPPDAKQIIAKKAKDAQAILDRNIQRLNAQYAQASKEIQSLNEVFTEQRLSTIRQAGLNVPAVIERYFGWQDALDQNPVGAIVALAKSYGLTPEQITEYKQSGAAQQGEYAQTIEQLQQEIEQLKGQQQEKFSDYELQTVRNQISQFGQEKGPDGEALRPFFEELKPAIRQLLPLVYEENPGISDYDALHQAWERARYASPQIRAQLDAQSKAKQKQDVQKAKAAGSSLVGTKTAPSAPRSKAKSIDEALEMALEEHGVRL